MYGLIGVAVKKLVETEIGAQAWEEICEKADFPEKDFIKTDCYDDKLIFELVQQVSDKLNTSTSEVLKKFGHYWIDFAISEGYGEAYKIGGNSFIDFLKNLNKLHLYVATSFSNLKPPHFQVVNESKQEFDLIYRSTRDGLEFMVVGLVEALGMKFNKTVSITDVIKDSEKVLLKVKYI
jgi:hypothetical protein